jgi:hypothetical protein
VGRVSGAHVERTVLEVIKRFDLDTAPAPDPDGLDVDPRHVQIDRSDVHFAETLDARRPMALGHLARLQTSLDLSGGATDSPDEVPPPHESLPPARSVVLNLHFDAELIDGSLSLDALGRLETGQRLLLLEQVQAMLGDSLTEWSVRPVIDLNQELTSAA